jgi:eukaryotic-like serine/threonine-protein kinase
MNDETRLSPPPTPTEASAAETAPDAVPSPLAVTLAQTPAEVERAAAVIAPLPITACAVPGYEIIGELGRGGMGVVYKARQVKLNRIVALKMVLSAQHADPRELSRFLGEAQTVAAIRHPHVIQVFDSGEFQGRPYMAMECLEGGSLVARLRNGGKMDPRAAAELVMKIARGVQAAHDRGIVHRDLKPHNVLLDAAPPGSPPGAWGEPKVTDFGLAKRGGASELTQTGAVMGTPAYMAPEQARGETKNVGPPADIYGLGIILYECLTGTVPFTGEDAWSVIRQVVSVEPEPVTRRVTGVPRDLDLICRKCLAKEPADRYDSATALADDLQRFLSGEAIRGPRTDAWYAARKTIRRWWRPVAVVVLLVALVVIAWLLPSPLEKPTAPANDQKTEQK